MRDATTGAAADTAAGAAGIREREVTTLCADELIPNHCAVAGPALFVGRATRADRDAATIDNAIAIVIGAIARRGSGSAPSRRTHRIFDEVPHVGDRAIEGRIHPALRIATEARDPNDSARDIEGGSATIPLASSRTGGGLEHPREHIPNAGAAAVLDPREHIVRVRSAKTDDGDRHIRRSVRDRKFARNDSGNARGESEHGDIPTGGEILVGQDPARGFPVGNAILFASIDSIRDQDAQLIRRRRGRIPIHAMLCGKDVSRPDHGTRAEPADRVDHGHNFGETDLGGSADDLRLSASDLFDRRLAWGRFNRGPVRAR